jgi:hypothetical protein
LVGSHTDDTHGEGRHLWAKVGASDSAPSEGSSLGEADDDLDDDDFDNGD